jgi:hypothetical protein
MDPAGQGELLVAGGASGREEGPGLEADGGAAERRRIVSRHMAALAEHERHLAELERGIKACCR